MTDTSPTPAEAFFCAKIAVEHGEFEKARSLYPLMFKSDQDVIERRIAAKQAGDSQSPR